MHPSPSAVLPHPPCVWAVGAPFPEGSDALPWAQTPPLRFTWDPTTHRRQVSRDPSWPPQPSEDEVEIVLGDALLVTLPSALATLWHGLRHTPLPMSDFHAAWAAADPQHQYPSQWAFASGLFFVWPHFQDQGTPINWDTLTLGRLPSLPFVDPWQCPPAAWDRPMSVRTLATLVEMTQDLLPGTGITAVTGQWDRLLSQDSVVAYYHGSPEWILRYVEHAQGFRSAPF